MANKLKKKIIKSNEVIKFTPKTEQYGCAEFQICPVFKYGKLKRVFVYPAQQPDAKYYYELEVGYADSFQLQSWQHKGYDVPWIWIFSYCKEHKCQTMRVYPPEGTDSFHFNVLSTTAMIFDKYEDKGGENNG